MGKNKEEFMKDREKEVAINDINNLIDNVNDKMINLEGELEETKHLLSKKEDKEASHLQMIEFYQNNIAELVGESEETKHLLSKCKTLISDMVLSNLNRDMYSKYEDVMKQSQELLTELKDY